MTTKYTVNGRDLSEIFEPGETPAITTNYTVLNSSGNPQDLNKFFAPYSPELAFKTTNANSVIRFTKQDGINCDYYLVTFTNSQGSIEFSSQSSITFNYLIVGGGGGGGFSSILGGGGGGGGAGGGGGGSIVTLTDASVNIPASTTINITVGAGGSGGYYDGTMGTLPTSGSPSYISYNTTTIDASGGLPGESVTDTTTQAHGGNSYFNYTLSSGGTGFYVNENNNYPVTILLPGGGASPINSGGKGTQSTNFPNITVYQSGIGGNGYIATEFDNNIYSGGGGGGGSFYDISNKGYGSIYGSGGSGGGGDGAEASYPIPGLPGRANTGGGGGGGGNTNAPTTIGEGDVYVKGGDGGSGIVILKIYN